MKELKKDCMKKRIWDTRNVHNKEKFTEGWILALRQISYTMAETVDCYDKFHKVVNSGYGLLDLNDPRMDTQLSNIASYLNHLQEKNQTLLNKIQKYRSGK
jgi:hypothetical protein